MKKNQLFIGLLSLFLIALLCSTFSINVKGANTLDFTFEKDVLYNNTGIQPLNETFNLRNQTEYTGHYPATYSFENEMNLIGTDIDFIDSYSCDNLEIIDELDGHSFVLNASGDSNYEGFQNNFLFGIDKGIIDFWIRFDSIVVSKEILIRNDDLDKILDVWWSSNGYLRFYDGFTMTNIKTYVADTWIHYSFQFDFTETVYTIIENGIDLGTFDYWNSSHSFDRLGFQIRSNALTTVYFDAIGYPWDETNYTGTNFDVGTEDTVPLGITWDGQHFWVVGSTNDKVYKYTTEGIYTGVYFDVSTEDTDPVSIIWDGQYFWVLGYANDRIYKYTPEGVYTGVHFDVGAQDILPADITWDGTHFWVVGNVNTEVYKYTSEGVYTGVHFDVGAQDTIPWGIIWDGQHFWVVGIFNTEVYKYTLEGVYTGVHFDVGAQDILPYGITWDGQHFWIIGQEYSNTYKYQYVEFPYNVGDNMIPILETNGSLEVDKYEFALEGINDFYDTGDENPSTWDTTTQGTGISQIAAGEEPTKDKIVYMFGTGVGNNFGIQKTNFDYTEKFIDINFGLIFIDWSGTNSFIMIEIHSSDATSIIGLAFYNDGRFAYIDGGVQVLRTDIDKEINYDIGLHIDYDFDVCWIYYTVEGVLNETYVIDLLATGKTGLKEIDIDSVLSGTEFTIMGLDYVGVYANGLSDAGEGEYGYLSIDLETPTVNWNFEHNNLFSIIASGKFAIYSNEGTYSIEDSIELIFSEAEYYNNETLRNIYDQGYTDIDNPFLVIYLSDNIFNNVSYLNIEGVKFSEGSNVYYPTYTHAGIDVSQSYFYVDSNNRLQFNLIANDGNLEYIQAVFDVQDVATENRSIRFYSNINGNSKAYFALDYRSERSSVIEFPYSAKITNIILSQTEIIQNFTILITDNDLEINDICTGYIKEIKLVYYTDLTTTITTLNLLAIIIPLIILVAPPTVLRERFGNKVVLPMFILMALICVVSQLIPIWLFFVIALGSLAFMVLKDKVEVKI